MTDGTGRVLALDLGEARVGVALSDPMGWTAQPRGFLPRRPEEKLLLALSDLAAEEGVVRVVIGHPLHMSGARGEGAVAAEAFAKRIEERTGLPVVLWDERWTTVAAERALSEGEVRGRRRREKVDALAAAILLQSYLDAVRSSST